MEHAVHEPDDIEESAEPASAVDRLFLSLAPAGHHVALLAAWIAVCGSLFFSNVLGWQPCLLCWYQRILMYPLAIIIAIGILRRDAYLHLYVLPVALLGMVTSLYHYLLIKTDLFPPPPCSSGVPCTVDYIDWLGFINIPFLALTAFVIITLAMVLALAVPTKEHAPGTRRLGSSDWAVFGIIVVVVGAFVVGARFV